MKARCTWILVSDGAEARVYKRRGLNKGLSLVSRSEFSHAEGQIDERQADEPEHFADHGDLRASTGGTPRGREKEKLAGELAKFLDKNAGEFEQLVLAAPPKMLGHLRNSLSKQQFEKTIAAIDKDLTTASDTQLEEHLQNIVNIDADRTKRRSEVFFDARPASGNHY